MIFKDHLYKVTFDKVSFHIVKLNIINPEKIKDSSPFIFLRLSDEPHYIYKYTCDNGETYISNYIDSFYNYNEKTGDMWICSSTEKCKEFINKFIHYRIDEYKYQIKHANEQLKFWNKKLKIYEK